MYTTGIHYYPLQKIRLKDNNLNKEYLTHPWWYTKISLSPKCHILKDFNSYFI